MKITDRMTEILSFRALTQMIFDRRPVDRRTFSKIDYYRLQNILTRQHDPAYQVHAALMKQLRRLLLDAQVCPCKEVPDDLVTMNSVLRLQSQRGSTFTITLVYPRDVNWAERKCSVLSLMGLDLIGKRRGDGFLRHMHISEIIYQPESTGKFYV